MDWLLWKNLSEEQITNLAKAFDPYDCKVLLASSLNLSPPTKAGDSKADIITDFFFYSYAFCKDHGLPANKVSTFMSLMKAVIDADSREPESASDSMEKSYSRFETLLLKHSCERPPYSISVFTPEDVTAIVEHATNHYFRQYKLYKYILTPKLQTTIQQTECQNVETPTMMRTLNDAMGMGVVVTFPESVEEEDGEIELTDE